jgi:hypothetical protein
MLFLRIVSKFELISNIFILSEQVGTIGIFSNSGSKVSFDGVLTAFFVVFLVVVGLRLISFLAFEALGKLRLQITVYVSSFCSRDKNLIFSATSGFVLQSFSIVVLILECILSIEIPASVRL